ncbi:hypothetical protein ACFV7Q_19610 [Streptomyces sp. NPDC059851]|uniref:hypothetical protein n=1 Tax=Streptomyces sp. NPDC059851 TaxID=3346971 RepID=UPI00365D4E24
MSYNQPGPYGGPPPQQPGPYGAPPPPPPPPAPGPYGQPAPQPGYGYPQQPPTAPMNMPPQPPPPPQPGPGYPAQPPTAPMGFPQQQPPYGYQQPGMPPQPYGTQPPKKSKAGVIIAAVVAVAVIAGGGWYLLGGGGGTIDEATKGQKLAFPASVDAYAKNEKAVTNSKGDAPVTGEAKTRTEALGIKDAHAASLQYVNGVAGKGKQLSANGYWGQIADPEKTLNLYFDQIGAPNPELDKLGLKYEKVGSPKEFTPDGFKGAVMKCVDVKMSTSKPTKPGEPNSLTVPFCVWSDYSTLVAVSHIDQPAIVSGGTHGTHEDLSKLAAKLYNTSRTKA